MQILSQERINDNLSIKGNETLLIVNDLLYLKKNRKFAIAMKRKILGIDPGSNITGYTLLNDENGLISFMEGGVLKSEVKMEHLEKVKSIFRQISQLLDRIKPDIVAIEDPFFGKNVQSMLKLGRTQGVIIAAVIERDIPIYEYAPRRIKQSVTGRGSASKDQVAAMVRTILGHSFDDDALDVTDAAAIALAFLFTENNMLHEPIQTKSKKNSWSQFIRQNPERTNG